MFFVVSGLLCAQASSKWFKLHVNNNDEEPPQDEAQVVFGTRALIQT
jgi:hypothetical protein